MGVAPAAVGRALAQTLSSATPHGAGGLRVVINTGSAQEWSGAGQSGSGGLVRTLLPSRKRQWRFARGVGNEGQERQTENKMQRPHWCEEEVGVWQER